MWRGGRGLFHRFRGRGLINRMRDKKKGSEGGREGRLLYRYRLRSLGRGGWRETSLSQKHQEIPKNIKHKMGKEGYETKSVRYIHKKWEERGTLVKG